MRKTTMPSHLSARLDTLGGVEITRDFGDPSAEYAAARDGAGLYENRLRGVIQVTGQDRAAWLNNLVTQQVKTLEPGSGQYAFALNLKGRILFDLNVLVLGDALWLDIDRRFLSKAMTHLDRYIISEDVQLRDRSDEFTRFALLGGKAAEIADALGAAGIEQFSPLRSASATLVQKNRLIVRNDLAGVFGAELFVEVADADACRKRLLEIGAPVHLRPVGYDAINILRVESGIPASVEDIDEEVLPAETQQLARAVSFKKGCYLGQEVVERMRSHNVLARQLVGVRLSGLPALPAPLHAGGVDVGRLTSATDSPTLGPIGLAYVKTANAREGTDLQVPGGTPIAAVVTRLPFSVQSVPPASS